MKVFISQVMNGRTDEEIIAEREDAKLTVEYLLGKDAEIIDSFIKEKPPEGCNIPLWYLGKSIELLSTADVLLEINKASQEGRPRGCAIEHQCAKLYGIDIRTTKSM